MSFPHLIGCRSEINSECLYLFVHHIHIIWADTPEKEPIENTVNPTQKPKNPKHCNYESVSVVSRVAQDVGLGENIFKGFNDVTKVKKQKTTTQVCHDSGSLVEIWKAWYW